jgi:hypothetical protein
MTCPARFATARTPTRPTFGPQIERVGRSLTDGRGLLPWQRQVVGTGTEVLEDGRMAYPVVVVLVPRRAGKTLLTLARQLQRISMPGRQRAWYTAQDENAAGKQFRLEWSPIIESAPYWRARIIVRRAAGDRGFWHRETGGAIGLFGPAVTQLHGLRSDDVTIDEAWSFDTAKGTTIEDAIRPTRWTAEQSQTWIVSAGGNEDSTWLDRWVTDGRAAVLEGRTDGLAYFEWSADGAAADYDPGNPAIWRAAHPALGLTIPERVLHEDYATMPRQSFERAVLNVWPRPSLIRPGGLDPATWALCADPTAAPSRHLVFGLDISRDRTHAAIVAVGSEQNGDRVAVEVLEHRAGTDWCVDRLSRLRQRHRNVPIVADELVAAGIIAGLTRAHIPVETTGARAMAAACSQLVDLANSGLLVHRGQAPLDAAVAGAGRRPIGDGWAWSRRASDAADISPLVAVTLAVWGWSTLPRRGQPRVVTVANIG